MIKVDSLYKSFGSLRAVKDLSFTVGDGEIYGLVGPDGAGKTTTLRLLVGALKSDNGSLIINGINLAEDTEKAREQVGYLSQQFSLYEDLTVMENVRFFAEVRGISRSEWFERSREILEFVGLDAFKDRLGGKLSGGMKQKLGLASALVGLPRILLLDEPTTGVDPVTRQDFWQLLVKLVSKTEISREKVSVLITTPYMDEATRCHRIGFMQSGELIAEGSPSQLRLELEGRILEIRSDTLREINRILLSIPGLESVRLLGDRLHVRTKAGLSDQVIDTVKEKTKEAGLEISSIHSVSASLEDVFIHLAGEGISDRSVETHSLPEAQSKVLETILKLIPPDQYNWHLSGSASLYIQGLDLPVNDLDIHSDEESIYQIEKKLKRFITSPVKVLKTGRIRSLDGKANIAGVEVDLIAKMQVKSGKGDWQDIIGSDNKVRMNWNGYQVPVLSLSEEIHIYSSLNRLDRVEQIQKFLEWKENARNE